MRRIWTYAAVTGLCGALLVSPSHAQPIGGGTPPPGKTQPPSTGVGGSTTTQPPGKTETPATPGKDNKEAEKDPIVDEAAKLFGENKVEEAYKKLQQAASKNDKLPPARLMLYRMYLSRNMAADARRTIELAATENPEHPDIYITFALLALQQARYTDAWLQFNRALLTINDTKRWNEQQRKSVSLACHSGLAQTAEARQQYDMAKKHFEEVLKLDYPKKDLAGFRASLGRVLFQLDKKEDALKELQAAYNDAPEMEPPGVMMAKLYTGKAMQEQDKAKQKELIAKAKEWFEYALKVDAKSFKAHIAYAVWLFDMNYLDKSYFALADEELKEAIKLDPKAYDTKILRGLMHRWQGNYEAAESEFETAWRERPNDFYSQNQLALALVEQKGNPAKQQRAVQLASENAQKYANQVPEATATYGYVMFKNNRLDDAEKALQMSFQSGQYTADALYYFALVNRYRGKLTEAAQMLKIATTQPGRFMFRKEATIDLEQLSGSKGSETPAK
jgi:tetratricopeptide (TPR) repeat protein